ncbi:LytTR family DNA-binding domain-containing protein [Carnobacterium divergens]|uniref:LytTR family DNA-binding domain-containing protein n=1 Tax=Carnobacterium divergens TaxID=2748 RepID=A0AAW8RAZ7_CARDV|nr:LytTR family DNA-binding domain-containing protein [Carnobacterium divergens]MDT1958393.1 LytTR family DNA-binding domain-containing protein [Carnobacterium divergens]MDT1974242.1 LytTR family DNA-binding domain-containing protein [Carnobacterium divergens]
MKIAICDDIPIVANFTERLLLSYKKDTCEVEVFYKPQQLIEEIAVGKFDLYILDIEFPNISGIELAKIIRIIDPVVPIIFLTNFKEYMEDVFKIQTFDYLLKPINKEKLYPVLDRVLTYLDVDQKKFIFKFRKALFTIPFSEIIYFEKNRKQVKIFTCQQEYVAIMTTKEILLSLDDNFVQIHASYILNIRYIREIKNSSVVVKYNTQSIELPTSRKFKNTIKTKILMKMREFM